MLSNEKLESLHHLINRAARRYANDPHEAEDIAQEIRLYIVWKCRDEDTNWFIYRKALNRALTHYRDAERYAAHINYLFATAESQRDEERTYNEILSDMLAGLNMPTRRERDLENEVMNREELQIIESIARSLPPRQKQIFVLRFAGLSFRQIADHLGITFTAVYAQMHGIRYAFRRASLAPALFSAGTP